MAFPLFGDAFSGFTNRLQQGFSGIQERMAEPNRADPKYHNCLLYTSDAADE